MSADLKTESTAFTYDRRSFRGVSYWPSTRGLGPSAHLSCVYLSLHPCSRTPPHLTGTEAVAHPLQPWPASAASSFLSVFLSVPGRASWRAPCTCGRGREPVSASATVAFLKLSESLTPAVGVARPGLLDRACDGGKRNEGSQSHRGLEANPSLAPVSSPSARAGAMGGAGDNDV